MSPIDLSPYLQDVCADQPCGPDLLYDAEYVQLAQIMQGTPEVEYGDMRVEAADPDWKSAEALALKLLVRTRDLRLVVWLTRAWVGQHGYAGLDDGLALIEGYIERYWDHVHPALDPEDGDPTERLNTIMALDDMDGLLGQVRVAALARSAVHGPVSLRDIDLATGELPARADDEPRKMAAIEAVFHAVPFIDLEGVGDAIERSCGRLERIEAILGGHLERVNAAALQRLPKTLRHAAKLVRDQLRRHPGAAPTPIEQGPDAEAMPAQGDGHPGRQASGDIKSRDDVARQIDRICDYYALEEPGSPVPMLLQRAKRLINMNFIEIMSELSPQGLAETCFLFGVSPGAPMAVAADEEAFSINERSYPDA
jgi:type VI secretion system protein ImpA